MVDSGYLIFLVFVVLLAVFFVGDTKLFRSKKNHMKAFIVAFWVIFCWGLFNPPVSGTYQVLFWGFRGLLLTDRANKT